MNKNAKSFHGTGFIPEKLLPKDTQNVRKPWDKDEQKSNHKRDKQEILTEHGRNSIPIFDVCKQFIVLKLASIRKCFSGERGASFSVSIPKKLYLPFQ